MPPASTNPRNKPNAHVSPKESKPIAGIAFSCLLSVVAVVALIGTGNSIPRSFLLWVLYVAACGMAIDVDLTTPPSRVVLYALFPAISLVLTIVVFFSFAVLAMANMEFSGSKTGPVKISDLTKILGIAALTGIVTLPGICAGCYARSKILQTLASLRRIPVKDIKNLRTKLNIIGSIVVLLLGFFLVMLPGK